MSDRYLTYPDSQFKIPPIIVRSSFTDSHMRRYQENHVIVPLAKGLREIKRVVNPIVNLIGIENPGFVHENPVQYRKEQIKFSLKDTRRLLRIIPPQEEPVKHPELYNLPLIKLIDEQSSSASNQSRQESLNAMTSSDLFNNFSSQQKTEDEKFSTNIAIKWYSQSRQESLDAMPPSNLTSSSLSRQESLDDLSSLDLTSSFSSRQESFDKISSPDLANNSFSRQDSEEALSSLDPSRQVEVRCGLSLTDATTTESFIMLVTCRHTLCSARLDTWPKDKVSCPSCKSPTLPSTRRAKDRVKSFVKRLIRGI